VNPPKKTAFLLRRNPGSPERKPGGDGGFKMVKDSSQTIKQGDPERGSHFSEMKTKSLNELAIILREYERQARQIRKELKRRFPEIETKYLALEFNHASPDSKEQAGTEVLKWN
jgi:hypothetical protein